MTAKEIIDYYTLLPHPEGGYYRRTYASALDTNLRGKNRPVCTAILFLLESGQYSRLHRIPQDEMWHFYLGDPLRLVEIRSDGETHEILMGHDIRAHQKLQYSVQGGSWFGATPFSKNGFSLVGCTVSPGFLMEELQLGNAEELTALFPSASHTIQEFCPPHSV